MSHPKPILLAAGVLLFAWAVAWALAPLPPRPPVEASAAAQIRPVFRFLGANSCAAAACHNGQGEPGEWRSEYTTWAARPREGQPSDKHAQAYDVLFTPASQLITRNLGRKKPAHQDALCLNCHVVADHDLLEAKGLLPENFVTDGVSCESCHGPADRWVTDHYRPSWKTLSAAEKAEHGMRDTRSLAGRARTCAQCHVGALPGADGGIGQDVNHDLYAAGHPPLVFEFSAYHATTLHHWQDAKDKDPLQGGKADFEARAWLVGQIVSAQSALDLLAKHAAQEDHPWPEFAQMDCFACHHDLKDPSSRRVAGFKGKPGSIPFRSWYFNMLPRSLETVAGKAEPGLDKTLADLKKEMEQPRPDRAKVAKAARDLSARLAPWIDKAEGLERLDLDALYRSVRHEDIARAKEGWDGAAQVYLSLAAVENAWSDLRMTGTHGNLPGALDEIRQVLRIPRGFLSPPRFDASEAWRKLDALRK